MQKRALWARVALLSVAGGLSGLLGQAESAAAQRLVTTGTTSNIAACVAASQQTGSVCTQVPSDFGPFNGSDGAVSVTSSTTPIFLAGGGSILGSAPNFSAFCNPGPDCLLRITTQQCSPSSSTSPAAACAAAAAAAQQATFS